MAYFLPEHIFSYPTQDEDDYTCDVYVNVTDYLLYAKKGFGKAIVGCCRKG